MSSASASPLSHADMLGRKLGAGPASCERFAKLLGVDTVPGQRVEAVAWVEDHLAVAVGADDGEAVTLCLEARRGDGKAMVETDKLTIWYLGSALPRALREAVIELAPQRLAGLGAEELTALIQQDPDFGRLGLTIPEVDEFNAPSVGHLHSWGAPDVYADFFAAAELQRHQLDSLDLFMHTTCVQHSDMECMCNAPVHRTPIVSLVNFPWLERDRVFDRRGEPEPFAQNDPPWTEQTMFTTSLTERDVLMGNPDKIDAVLKRALANPRGDLVLFSNTCVPVVVGEDVESVVAEHQKNSDVPLLYLTLTPQSMDGVLAEVLVNRRQRAEATAEAADPQTVNLIGFARDHGTAGLRDLLAEGGVHVNEVLIPNLDPGAVERLSRAAVNVYWPNALWKHLYAQLQIGSQVKPISPPAPYGFRGTGRWLRAVGDAVGRGEQVEAAWRRQVSTLKPQWAALRRQAAEQKLCFVARSSQIDFLTDPEESWGVPLLDFATEMGFDLEVLIHARGRDDAQQAVAKLRAALPRPKQTTVQAFSSWGRMMKQLTQSDAQSVFTQHFFDWRITSAGKMPFSVLQLEHGLQGALSSQQRLLGRGRVPFFNRYQRYLRRGREGQRLAVGGPADPAGDRRREGGGS